jgi:outer membrane protein
MNTKARLIALAALATLVSANAFAQKAGDWQIGTGWMHLAPQDSSTPLKFTSPVQAEVPGSGASVSNADTLGLNVTYFVDSHWAVEGVFGVPPKFELNGTGTLGSIGKLGEAKQWSPAFLGKYYFGEGSAKFRPFAGLGVTHVSYSDVKLTDGLQAGLNANLGLPAGATTTKADLSSSWAPVYNVGAGYQFNEHWGVSLSVSYIPLKTTAKLSTSTAAGTTVATSEATLKVNPIVTYASVNYRF